MSSELIFILAAVVLLLQIGFFLWLSSVLKGLPSQLQSGRDKSFMELQMQILRGLKDENEQSMKFLSQFRFDLQKEMSLQSEKLTEKVESKLNDISQKVQESLSDGLKQTTKTFVGIMERLGRIDEAQKKIEQLSTNVVSLQDVLTDKKTRGIFGEVQLTQLLVSVFGEGKNCPYALQQTLSNRAIADAVLFLPDPIGTIAVDSKFPLENYRRLVDPRLAPTERKEAATKFKKNVKKHIDDIAGKYILEGETSDQAILFLPAEAIFAEIHAHHPELIEHAQKKRVWCTSPTTFMAVLTTLQVTLNNMERSKYADVIHQELEKLGREFVRYRDRWNKLAQHIETVSKDVKEIHVTTDKISERFGEIGRAELQAEKALFESNPL